VLTKYVTFSFHHHSLSFKILFRRNHSVLFDLDWLLSSPLKPFSPQTPPPQAPVARRRKSRG
jgi:hypothetical protein